MNLRGAIIGSPVAHSLSPLIHEHWLAEYGLTGSYERREVAPEDLSNTIPELFAQGYTGLNVTLPHKQTIMKLCRSVDDTGRVIGAVNTLIRRTDGFDAINTDWFGFVEALIAAQPDFDFQRARVTILGAGGAARSAIYGLQRRGVPDIRLANRSGEAAAILARDFGVTAVAWDQREAAAHGADLLVNTTSLGLAGKPPLAFDVAALSRRAIVYDIVYTPRRTELLHAAAGRGLAVVEGLGMLIHQARLAFHAWTDILPDADAALEDKLYAALAA